MSTEDNLPRSPYKLLASVDFGTAFSSVAYYIDRRSVPERVRGLPLERIVNRLRPLRFNNDNQVSSQIAWDGIAKKWVWGDEVNQLITDKQIEITERIEMLKLCLETSDMNTSTRAQVRHQLRGLPSQARKQLNLDDGFWPDRLITYYLEMLWNDAKARIFTKEGTYFHENDTECWISIPKLWSPELNERMIVAATRAGFPKNVRLVHEPEAALIYCIAQERYAEEQAAQEEMVTPGQKSPTTLPNSVMVVDAGCGTVDIGTYLTAMQGTNITIDEGIRGTAGLLGSGILNQRFLELIRSILAKNPSKEKHWKDEAQTPRLSLEDFKALEQFEERKKYFGTLQEKQRNRAMLIYISGQEKTYANSTKAFGALEIPRATIKALFDSIIDRIIDMMKERVNTFNSEYTDSPLTRILVVGGFSTNIYFLDRIRAACTGPECFAGYDIEVTSPEQDSATIVAKGALLRALHNPMGRRVLAQSYGFAWDEEYCPERHKGAKPFMDYHENYPIAKDRIVWPCKVNQTFDPQEPEIFRVRGFRYIPTNEKAIIYEKLYRSYTETQDHASVRHSAIKQVGELELDLTQIDRRGFRIHETFHKGIGKEQFHIVDYEVQLTFDGVRLTYKIIIPEGGQWWGWDNESMPHDRHWGRTPLEAKATMENVDAAFDVSGYRKIRKDASPNQTDSSRPQAKRKSSLKNHDSHKSEPQRQRTRLQSSSNADLSAARSPRASRRRMPFTDPSRIQLQTELEQLQSK